jgi:excisionase family DNA binding protein
VSISDVDDLLTVEEALKKLKICKTKLYQYVNRGELKAVKFGRAVRFRPVTLQAFLEGLEGAPEKAELVRGRR